MKIKSVAVVGGLLFAVASLASAFTVLAPTATPTITPTPLPRLVGHVTIEGRPGQPNALQSVPITFTLKVLGGGAESNYSTNTETNHRRLFTFQNVKEHPG